MFKATYLILPVLIWIVYAAIRKEIRNSEKNMDESCFSVRQSKIVLWISILCTLLFFLLLVAMAIFPNDNDTGEWGLYLAIPLLFIAIGTLMTLYCIKWEIKIENDRITYTPFLGKKKTFLIRSIKEVKAKDGRPIKVCGEQGKLFSVEPNCRGCNVLISRLKRESIPFEENY
jgi:amino acid permease